MSVAVWVGLLALAGLDAETGVVMLLYLDHAWEKFRAEGRMNSMRDLRAAIHEGAVQRLRPKIMTVCAILFGLLAHHVVARHANRRRRHETYRRADDRRRCYFGASGVAYLPDNFLDVARAESRCIVMLGCPIWVWITVGFLFDRRPESCHHKATQGVIEISIPNLNLRWHTNTRIPTPAIRAAREFQYCICNRCCVERWLCCL